MAFNEKAWHVGFKWTIGDEDNPTGAICLDDSSDALHICEIRDARTDWNVSTTSHPTVYVHSASDPATDYISMYHDGTSGIITLDGTTILTLTATTLDIAVATTIAGDLDITTDDIAISQGYHVYFDGLGVASEHIMSDTENYLEINATTGITLTIGNTDELLVTATAVTIGSNNLSVATGSYIYLDGGVDDYLRATTDNNVLLNGRTTVNLGVFGTTEVAVDSAAVTLATNNLTLTAGNISVAVGKYVYLDGQGGGDYLRAYTDNNVTLNGGTTVGLGVNATTELEVDATNVTLATNNLVLTTGDIKVATTKYIYFDGGTNDYIRCYSDNNLIISGGTTSILGIAGASVITAAAASVTIAQATTINAALTVGSNGTGHDVIFYGATSGANVTWDEDEDYLLFAGAGRLEVGTFATPISLDTFTGNEDIHGAMVSSVINAAMTAGEVSRNVWSRMKITADQTANVSVYGACLQLRAHTGSQTVELGAGLYAGAWLYYEGSDADNILTISGGEHCAAAATVELSSAQLVTGGSVYGIKINSAIDGGVSMASADSFAALYINAGSGKEPWTNGIEMAGDHVVTGITLNAATTGLVITGTYATATSKAINSAITVDVPNYTDGLGANNFDLTTTGVMAGHSAATSSWININGTVASGGVIVAAQTNGIWVNTGGSGNITNAIAVIGMRMSAITTTNASKLTCFSVNVSGDTLDGIFHVAAGATNLGEVANAGTALSFLVPLYINDAGVKKYVKLYDLQ